VSCTFLHPKPNQLLRASRKYAEQIGLALFNLERDITETKDVAAQHPEIVKRLEVFAEKCREELGLPDPTRRKTCVHLEGSKRL
jgi:hypothetical protein